MPLPLIKVVAGVQKPIAPAVITEVHVVTLAEVNAGKVLVLPVKLCKLRLVGLTFIPAGSFGVLTAIVLADTGASPVTIVSLAQAQLTDGAVLIPGATGVTLGAGFAADLTMEAGLKISKTGSAGTVATSIKAILQYQIIDS